MTGWRCTQLAIAGIMVLVPAGVMAWRWVALPCPDPLWHRAMVAAFYTLPCVVQFWAIVAIVNMTWHGH